MITSSLAKYLYFCSVKRMLCARVCTPANPAAKPFAEKSGKLRNSGWGVQADVCAHRRESFALVYLHGYFQTPSAETSLHQNEFTPECFIVCEKRSTVSSRYCQFTIHQSQLILT